MPSRPPNARGRINEVIRKARVAADDRRRGSSSDRGYDANWAAARRAHLREHPLCRYCELLSSPRITPASLVDHFWPHKGDRELFWDQRFWVSSCKPCHDGPKQRLERAGIKALRRVAALLGLPDRYAA